MNNSIFQIMLYLIILMVLAIPLGKYIGKIMNGEKVFLSKILELCESGIYKLLRINKEEDMTWKRYSITLLLFSGVCFVFLFLLHMLQGVLPLNPENVGG